MSYYDLDALPIPKTTSAMVGFTIRVYFRYFFQWLALSVLAFVPVGILLRFFMGTLFDVSLQAAQANLGGQLDLAALAGPVLILALGGIAVSLFQLLVMGGAGSILATTALRDKPPSLNRALGFAFGTRLRSLILGHVYVGVILIAAWIISALLVFLCIGVVGLWICFYAIVIWMPLLAPVLVLERGSVRKLTRRAWYFGKKRAWLLLGATLALTVWQYAVSLPLDAIAWNALNGILIGPRATIPQIEAAYGQIIWLLLVMQFILQTVTVPFRVIFFTLVYHDTRWLYDPPVADDAVVDDIEYPPPQEPYLTSADAGNVFLIPLVMIVVTTVLQQLLAGALVTPMGYF